MWERSEKSHMYHQDVQPESSKYVLKGSERFACTHMDSDLLVAPQDFRLRRGRIISGGRRGGEGRKEGRKGTTQLGRREKRRGRRRRSDGTRPGRPVGGRGSLNA